MAIEMIEEFDQGTQIKVIGVGGGGGNAVQHMIGQGVQGVDFIVANTDAQALNRSSASTLVQLGSTGLGAGAKPEAGRVAAEAAIETIRGALDGAHMLFITAGMGGGTGTGAAPVIARVAREMGILTVGVVTKPFDWEGGRRMTNADAGLAELEANVDSLMTSTNPNIQRVLGVTGGMGAMLGLDNRWAYNIIKAVGNYGESFERNIGAKTPLKLERGLNQQWTKGGILYAWPIR
jgi:cell division protein FtsZ